MKKIIILALIYTPLALSSYKQLTCPFYSDDKNGLLENSAWRIDKFIFSPEDFNKDEPYLTHNTNINYKLSEEDQNLFNEFGFDLKPLEKIKTEQTSSVRYSLSPTHLTITYREGSTYVGINSFVINRSNLSLAWDAGNITHTSECKIDDLKTPEKNIF